MSINVYPEPGAGAAGASQPYGTEETVFEGKSTAGTYSYASSIAPGNYALSAYSLNGKAYGAQAYSATAAKTVNVVDGETEYFDITTAASDWQFKTLGSEIDSVNVSISNAALDGSSIFSLASGNGKYIAGHGSGVVSISNSSATVAQGWSEHQVGESGTTYVDYGNSTYFAAAGGSTSNTRVSWSTDGNTWSSSNLDRYSSPRIASRFVNDRFFFVGNRGFVAHSTDGTSWSYLSGNKPQTSSSWTTIWDGSKFIDAGATGNIYISTTGAGWDRYTTPITTSILTLRFLNGLYIAAGQSGNMITSTNATSWTQVTSSFGSTGINALTYGNGLYVAAGDAGQMRTSTDAVTWTSVTSNFGTSFINALAYGAGVYVAGGQGGTLTYSTDGTTWTATTSGFGTSIIYGIEFVNGVFVAAGVNRASSSTDGITWTGVTPAASTTFYAITYGNGRYVLTSTSTSNSYQSTDLVTWTAWDAGGSVGGGSVSTIRGVAYNGTDTFIASGSSGDTIGSTDGITWSRNYPSVFNEVEVNAINYDGTNYVFHFGSGNYVAKSTDLVTWTFGTANNFYTYVRYGNGTYVGALNNSGAPSDTALSTDGITWGTPASETTYATYKNLEFIDGYFWKLGYTTTTTYPRFGRSTDGVTWTTLSWAVNEAGSGDMDVVRSNNGWQFTSSLGYLQYVTSTTGTSLNYFLGNGRTAINGAAKGSTNLVYGTTGRLIYSDSLTPTTFTITTYPTTSTTTNSIAFGNGRYVVCTSTETYESTDNGATLVSTGAGTSNAVSYSSVKDTWIVAKNVNNGISLKIGSNSWISGSFAQTYPNGTAVSTSAIPYSAASGDGYFLVGMSSGSVAWSTDGRYWTPIAPVGHTSYTFYGAAVGNGKGVVGGTYGAILYADYGSTDWKRAASPFGITEIKSMAFNNGTFIAVNDIGQVGTSPDGVTWTLRTVDFKAYGVTALAMTNVLPWGSDEFIICAPYGSWVTSSSANPIALRLVKVDADILA